MYCIKLGFNERKDEYFELVGDLFEICEETQLDFTIFFRELANIPSNALPSEANKILTRSILSISEKNHYKFLRWLNTYLKKNKHIDTYKMKLFNPK